MSRTENAYIASMVKVKTLFSIYYTHTTDFSDNTTCNTLLRYEPSRTLFSIVFPTKCTSFGVILRYHATTNLVWCVFHPFPCTWVQLCWSSIGIDLQWKRRWNHFSLKELMVVKISRCGLIIQLQRTVFRLLTPKKWLSSVYFFEIHILSSDVCHASGWTNIDVSSKNINLNNCSFPLPSLKKDATREKNDRKHKIRQHQRVKCMFFVDGINTNVPAPCVCTVDSPCSTPINSGTSEK